MLLTNVCSIHYPAKIRQYFFEKTDFEGLAMRLTIAEMRSPCQSATVVWTFRFAQGDNRVQQTGCHSWVDLKENTNSTL